MNRKSSRTSSARPLILANRRGQFSETMTFAPILLLIVFLMALFLLASYWASNSRETGKRDVFSDNYLTGDSVLFKAINISGNNTLVAEEMIRSFYSSTMLSDDFKIGVRKIMRNDIMFSGEESCLLLAIDDFSVFSAKEIVVDSSYNRYNVYYIKDSEGKVVSRKEIEESAKSREMDKLVFSSLIEVKLKINNKEISLMSYYGGCK